jgi:hypothetical protein
MPRFSEVRAFLAGAAALLAKRLVKLDGATVVYNTATATDDPIGVTEFNVAANGDAGIRMLCSDETQEITAAGVIAVGDDVYAAADGKVQTLPAGNGTYRRVGKALEAATADGDIIEILPYNDGKTTVVNN